MCNDNKTCISNYQVCDGVSDCQNSEDENQALCKIELGSEWRSSEYGGSFDAHCTSRLDAQIEWHLDQEFVKLNELVHWNITETFRTDQCMHCYTTVIESVDHPIQKCLPYCRIRISQVRNRSDNTFVSKLKFYPVRLSDFGYYYCQVLGHRSNQFHLKYGDSFGKEMELCWFVVGISDQKYILPNFVRRQALCRYDD
ncbi:hypothetical protein ElyMa_000586800 [Elysia marginata]|uniref:Ig-like domain-containing protein n=1 Tax=Elysia marginata TaxID=1093978 RepID=A0AAV4G5D1_9GAST|nr:hypothetical protein ElyMa_000586800 [Elysia marginata]